MLHCWHSHFLGIGIFISAVAIPQRPDWNDGSYCSLHLWDFWLKPTSFWGTHDNNFRAWIAAYMSRSMTMPLFLGAWLCWSVTTSHQDWYKGHQIPGPRGVRDVSRRTKWGRWSGRYCTTVQRSLELTKTGAEHGRPMTPSHLQLRVPLSRPNTALQVQSTKEKVVAAYQNVLRLRCHSLF